MPEKEHQRLVRLLNTYVASHGAYCAQTVRERFWALVEAERDNMAQAAAGSHVGFVRSQGTREVAREELARGLKALLLGLVAGTASAEEVRDFEELIDELKGEE